MSKKFDKNQPKSHPYLQALANFSQIGITLAVSVLMGVLLGRFLDQQLDSGPWFVLVGGLLGAGAAFKLVMDYRR